MEKKYLIKTYGCQMNEHDSERMSYILESLGYKSTDKLEEADLIIYNTCSVRENADNKVYGHLGSLKKLKEKNKDLIIAICGCMMELKEARDIIRDKYKHVDIVFGTKNINSIPYLLDQYNYSKERIIDVEETDDIDEIQDAIRKNQTSAYINIIYGCNNFCSYCIVPYTRGRESSRSEESILKEVKKLADDGFKEITLLGQNVNSYGKDLHPCTTFSDLLNKISLIEGIERIRFISSHPKDISDDLIFTIKSNPKVCKCIHLPIQSGSKRILKEMNRKYTKDEYLEKINKIKKEIPDIAITTDIIIGFPGESEDDFLDTLDVINKVKYDQAFIFKYSKRTGTKAAIMDNQISEEVKSERFQILLDRVNDICLENNSKYLNKEVKVLFDEISKTDKNMMSGRTDRNKIVHVKYNKDYLGKICSVIIKEFNSFALEGEIIEQ